MVCKLEKQGLYDPQFEHDACGIGAVVNINGKRDHAIIEYGKETIVNLHHRGAAGADVMALIELVRERVKDKTGTQLELEVKFVGDFQR